LLYINSLGPYIYIILEAIALVSLLFVINSDYEYSFKLIWSIVILAVPILGVGLYLLIGNSKLTSKTLKKMYNVTEETNYLYKYDTTLKYKFENDSIQKQITYLTNKGFPVYNNSKAYYLSWGEIKWQEMLAELKKAKKFIFIEYFIVEEGLFWDSILEILEQKIKEGVEVRVMYDDFGCISTLPKKYYKTLEKKGIKAIAFNPLKLYFSVRFNNRDHRKICVIDGNTGFCGGINLADEYINEKERFGIWKDTALLIRGSAVWSLTLMFLQNWNTHRKEDADFEIYRPDPPTLELRQSDEFILPYGDSPLDLEPLGRNVYINMINNAKKYVYITTPYLICDQTIMNSLCQAAENGIDVRIITPGIYDKKMVSWLTKDSYRPLLKSGVKIYEYTPGFIHAKVFVSDNDTATVGTINLDYRSLYHHFENGVFVYNNQVVWDIEKDFQETLAKCEKVSLTNLRSRSLIEQIVGKVLRLVAPLM
jgi:cardiolipin synthase